MRVDVQLWRVFCCWILRGCNRYSMLYYHILLDAGVLKLPFLRLFGPADCTIGRSWYLQVNFQLQ